MNSEIQNLQMLNYIEQPGQTGLESVGKRMDNTGKHRFIKRNNISRNAISRNAGFDSDVVLLQFLAHSRLMKTERVTAAEMSALIVNRAPCAFRASRKQEECKTCGFTYNNMGHRATATGHLHNTKTHPH